MNSAICTLFEGDYHYGVGALVNSLYHHGFRGVVWVGYRGDLPPWATNLQICEGYKEFSMGNGCSIRFVLIDTTVHFANYKPTFMMDVWDRLCPQAEALFYFDPDIVIKCRWSFYEEWVKRGIAVCQELVNSDMPTNHPIRLAWKEYLEQQGFLCHNQLNQYFSSGFIGVSKEHKTILSVWKQVIDSLKHLDVDITQFFTPLDRSYMILSPDQDALNIAMMTTSHPLSTIGPEGMDFVPSGFTMSHAVGTPKPWKKFMIRQALAGSGPSRADKEYLRYVQQPIALYSQRKLFWKRIDLKCGAAIGRFVRRS